jgi:hypothetical protein
MGTWPGLGMIEIIPSGGMLRSLSDERISWNYMNLPGAPAMPLISQVA